MADVKKTPDEMQEDLAAERRRSEALEAEIDLEAEQTKPPAYTPDHASDGGVI